MDSMDEFWNALNPNIDLYGPHAAPHLERYIVLLQKFYGVEDIEQAEIKPTEDDLRRWRIFLAQNTPTTTLPEETVRLIRELLDKKIAQK